MLKTERLTRLLYGGLLALYGTMALVGFTESALAAPQPPSCTEHALEAERHYQLPPGILLSIALVESGQNGIPVPFAINTRGRSVMTDSREEAARHLRDASGRLRDDVFVGCMQIALEFHKDRFRPIERILDPRDNVFYAGGFLKRLRAETGSWTKAVQRYQGGSRGQRLAYVCKVHQRLATLHPDSAALLDAAHCSSEGPVRIAPETRRKFKERQVAQLTAIN